MSPKYINRLSLKCNHWGLNSQNLPTKNILNKCFKTLIWKKKVDNNIINSHSVRKPEIKKQGLYPMGDSKFRL